MSLAERSPLPSTRAHTREKEIRMEGRDGGKELTLINSSLINSLKLSMPLVTLNKVTTISTAEYPAVHNSSSASMAGSTLPLMHAVKSFSILTGCGWSHTLKTSSAPTKLNPDQVDWRLLTAWRMSPSEVKTRAVNPSSLYLTCVRRAGAGGRVSGGSACRFMWWGNRKATQSERKSKTHAFDFADFEQALEQLFVAQAGVPEDGAPRLDRFDNLVALVAREGEPGRVGVEFHRAAEGLLRSRRHRVGFVEDDELVPPEREGDFFLRKRLYPVSHDVDAALSRGNTGSGLGPR